jgi:O-methyltransferase involved in polyketide biosynthesis
MYQHARWDILSGVGLTAPGVAAGRAIETHWPEALVHDPSAEAFVQAARPPVPMPTRLAATENVTIPWASMATYLGVRCCLSDESSPACRPRAWRRWCCPLPGLIPGAFRLDWSPATTVYELEAPKVLQSRTGY